MWRRTKTAENELNGMVVGARGIVSAVIESTGVNPNEQRNQ